jgi:hypothetical protein
VAPSGQGADKQEDQDDDQDDSHDTFLLFSFILVEIISITYFSDPVGQSAITKNKRLYDKIRIIPPPFFKRGCQDLFLAPMMTNTIPPASATPPKIGGKGMVFLVSWVAWIGPISMIFSRLV